jgi:hypothetical protein
MCVDMHAVCVQTCKHIHMYINTMHIYVYKYINTHTLTPQLLPRGHFSLIVIDEAAQALEPEILIPLSLAGSNTRVCMSGDWQQIGAMSITCAHVCTYVPPLCTCASSIYTWHTFKFAYMLVMSQLS